MVAVGADGAGVAMVDFLGGQNGMTLRLSGAGVKAGKAGKAVRDEKD
jgi:hypothetical protein